MIETYIDFAAGVTIQSATTNANEMTHRNEKAGWNLIQSQLIQSGEEFIYSMLYQRAKEIIVDQKNQEKQFGELDESINEDF